MLYSELKSNQKVELELESQEVRLLRGLVIDKDDEDDCVVLVDEFGEFRRIYPGEIVSIQKFNFDKRVIDILYDYKKLYSEKEKYLSLLKELETTVAPKLKESLVDARFLTNFNIHGASVRIEKFLGKDNLEFKSNGLVFEIVVNSNLNDQVELKIKIKNLFEYYDIDNKEKLIEQNAPNKKESIDKIFSTDSIEMNRYIQHIEDDTYFAVSEYLVTVPVSEINFYEKKKLIFESIQKLKRNSK